MSKLSEAQERYRCPECKERKMEKIEMRSGLLKNCLGCEYSELIKSSDSE